MMADSPKEPGLTPLFAPAATPLQRLQFRTAYSRVDKIMTEEARQQVGKPRNGNLDIADLLQVRGESQLGGAIGSHLNI